MKERIFTHLFLECAGLLGSAIYAATNRQLHKHDLPILPDCHGSPSQTWFSVLINILIGLTKGFFSETINLWILRFFRIIDAIMVGFIYNFWCSLFSTSSILDSGSSPFIICKWLSCFLWFLHEKECSFYTYLFCCTVQFNCHLSCRFRYWFRCRFRCF